MLNLPYTLLRALAIYCFVLFPVLFLNFDGKGIERITDFSSQLYHYFRTSRVLGKKKKSQVKPYAYTFVVNKEAGAIKLTGSIQLTLKKIKNNNNKKIRLEQ